MKPETKETLVGVAILRFACGIGIASCVNGYEAGQKQVCDSVEGKMVDGECMRRDSLRKVER